MFLKLNILTRIIILFSTFIGGIYLENFLYRTSIVVDHQLIKIMASLLMCLIPIIMAFTLFQTFKSIRFHQRVYRQRFYEKGFFFKIIGVLVYQHILITSFLRHANPRVYLKGRKRDYIKIYYEETKQSETSHLFSLFATWPIQISFLTEGEYFMFFSLTIFTILFNFYPIQLQRKNRFVLEERFKNLIK